MKKITVKEIPQVLSYSYEKGTDEKPYSILFVSELDDSVKEAIEKWIENTKEKCNYTELCYYYRNNYRFSSNITDSKISYLRYEVDYSDGSRNLEHEAYKALINKKGEVTAKELKLSIISVYTPLWYNNAPIYGENDCDMFDEVYEVELNLEVFKEQFITYIDKIKEHRKSESEYNELMEAKKIGLHILNHPKFHFIPITETSSGKSSFVPLDFYRMFDTLRRNDNNINETIEKIQKPSLNIPQVAKDMFIEILREYK